jgi:hypothetical protein
MRRGAHDRLALFNFRTAQSESAFALWTDVSTIEQAHVASGLAKERAMRRMSLLCAALCTLCGCASPTNPTGSPEQNRAAVDASGVWVRSDSCTNAGGIHLEGCAITLTIMQAGPALSGTFIREGTHGGSLTGSVDGINPAVTLRYTDVPDCHITIMGVLNGDRWTGNAVSACTSLYVSSGQAFEEPIAFVRQATTP